MSTVTERQAAGIALVALRSSLLAEDVPRTGVYNLLPSLDDLSLDQIIERMATLQKPLICVAARVGIAIGIACWRPPNEDLEERQARQEFRRAASRQRDVDDADLIALREPTANSSDSDVIVRRDELRRALEQYEVLNTDLAIGDPDDRARAAGAFEIAYFPRQPAEPDVLRRDAQGNVESITIRAFPRPPGR